MRRTCRLAAHVWDARRYVECKAPFQGQFATEMVQRHVVDALRESTALLDLGCGDGSHTSWMADLMPTENASILGLDPSEDMIAVATANQQTGGRTRFQTGDIADPSVSAALAGCFDLVTSFHAIHWIPEARLPDTLAGVRRVLRPSGKLFAFFSASPISSSFRWPIEAIN